MNPLAALPNRRRRWERAWEGLFWAALAVLLGRALCFHARLIGYPFPLDLSEPAQALLARGVAQGHSTGDVALWPGLSSHYGPLYPLLTGFLCRHGLACGLPGQRLLCAGCLGLILALFVAMARRLGSSWATTAGLGLWLYELLLIHFTPVSRPDALGLLLYFAGLAAPFLWGEGIGILGLSASLFTLAALTKVYFILGAGFLALGLARRHRSLLAFCAAQVVALGIAAAWLRAHDPMWGYVVVLNQTHNLNFDEGHMLLQLWVVLVLASPLFVPLLAAGRFGLSLGCKRDVPEASGSAVDLPWGLYGACGLLLFVFVFGGARGGLFTYLIQLSVLPFAVYLAGTAARLERGPTLRVLLLAALLVNGWAAGRVALHPGFDPGSPVLSQWRKAAWVVDQSRAPVLSSDLALLAADRGLPVYDTGLSDFSWTLHTPLSGWKLRVFPHLDVLQARWKAWRARTRAALLNPRTDLVEVSNYGHFGFRGVLRTRYRLLGRIQIGYPQCGWATYWLSFYAPKGRPWPEPPPGYPRPPGSTASARPRP